MADIRAATIPGETIYEIATLRHLERRLAYLSQRAVITEAHRITAAITSRLIRIAPTEILHFEDLDIPAGVSHPYPLPSAPSSQPSREYNSAFFIDNANRPRLA